MQTNSYHYLLKTILVFGLLFSVSCFYIIPLRAGTIQITDNDVRSNKILRKQINLQLKRELYQSHKDIQVIASFSQLSMDDKLNFYFDYNIFCPQADCFLNFTVFRKTEVVNPHFIYSFDVDYLVARGLKILQLNMTSYQEHLNLRDIKSYNANNEKEDLGKFLPINNGDAMRIIAIPNGFSNLTRTGRVVYMYTMNEDMYVVHYMQHENGHGQHDAMGWPQGLDYIKYKILFFDASYLPNGCTIQDKWALTYNYQSNCGKKDKIKWFYGFKSTKQKSIKGYFTENKVAYTFLLNEGSSRYGTVAFPLFNNPVFIDERLTRTDNNQKLIYLLLVPLTFIVYIFLYRSRQKNTTIKIQTEAFEKVDQKSETFNSERDPNQQIQNIVSVQNPTTS